MGWFTDTGDAPKIYDGKKFYFEQYSMFVGKPGDGDYEERTSSRRVTETPFRIEGLTQAAADTIAAEYADDTSANYIASAERSNDAGGYRVRVTEITYGAWT